MKSKNLQSCGLPRVRGFVVISVRFVGFRTFGFYCERALMEVKHARLPGGISNGEFERKKSTRARDEWCKGIERESERKRGEAKTGWWEFYAR